MRNEFQRSRCLAAGVFMSVALWTAQCQAQTPAFYAAGDLGASRYRVALTQNNVRISDGLIDRNSTSGAVALGWQFTPSIGFEVGYLDFGRTDLVGRGTIPCQPSPGCTPIVGNLSGSIRATALQVSSVGSLPVSDRFSLMGRIGLARTDYATTVSIAGAGGKSNDDKTEGFYGVGASYGFTKAVEGVLEWKWIGTAKLSTAALGVRVRF